MRKVTALTRSYVTVNSSYVTVNSNNVTINSSYVAVKVDDTYIIYIAVTYHLRSVDSYIAFS